jgi:hypothetical protein
MQRRRFLFWVSLGMFQAGEALGVSGLDRLAAATINVGRRRRASTSATTNAPTGVVEPTSVDATNDEPPLDEEDEGEPGSPDAKRKARHGRPPSKWLRSLDAEELRIFLDTIEPNEAGVSGMTFWTHLTRDHYFSAEKIDGLTEAEQAKLHAAAHDGY